MKKSLKVNNDELKKLELDPAYNINMTGDIKQMLKELGTKNGKEIALHGGGGNKAQNERATAFATSPSSGLSPAVCSGFQTLEDLRIPVAYVKTFQHSARSCIKKDFKSDMNGEAKVQPGYSIVSAASSSVHGRSEEAKAAPSDKTAARIAIHIAGY